MNATSAHASRREISPRQTRRTALRTIAGLAAMTLFAAAAPVASAEPLRQLKWDDLVPPPEKYDDPFLALSNEQKMDLSLVAVARQAKARGEALAPKQVEAVEAASARLKKDKVDVDGLLARRTEIMEKRRRAAEAVNESLNGQQVRLPGYLLPLENDGRKVTEFLLVPYVGACIHAPTPPPNQIVHVKHAGGFEATGMFDPVWVQGVMRTVSGSRLLSLVDGVANVPTGYALDAKTVEPYRQ